MAKLDSAIGKSYRNSLLALEEGASDSTTLGAATRRGDRGIGLVSLCGVRCYICEQYLDGQCRGCFGEKGKWRDCSVARCLTDKEYSDCFSCVRAGYCKKRRGAINACFVRNPRGGLKAGMTYLVPEKSDRIFLTVSKHLYQGWRGLIFTREVPEEIRGKFSLERARILRLAQSVNNSAVDPGDLDRIRSIISEFTMQTRRGVVLIDSLSPLLERNPFMKVKSFIIDAVRTVFSTGVCMAITTYDIPESQEEVIGGMIMDFLTGNVLKAVSNPKRREILAFLRQRGKASFSEICEALGYLVPSQLSFHLKFMKDSLVLEQDDNGVYFISNIGREIDESVREVCEKVVERERLVRMLTMHNELSDWAGKYEKYLARVPTLGNAEAACILREIRDSLNSIFGEHRANYILQAALSTVVETENLTPEAVKRLVSEIAFEFLARVMPLHDAVSWADDILKT